MGTLPQHPPYLEAKTFCPPGAPLPLRLGGKIYLYSLVPLKVLISSVLKIVSLFLFLWGTPQASWSIGDCPRYLLLGGREGQVSHTVA